MPGGRHHPGRIGPRRICWQEREIRLTEESRHCHSTEQHSQSSVHTHGISVSSAKDGIGLRERVYGGRKRGGRSKPGPDPFANGHQQLARLCLIGNH